MQGIEPAPLPGQKPTLSTASHPLCSWRDPGNAVSIQGSAETHFTLVLRQENPKESLGIFHLKLPKVELVGCGFYFPFDGHRQPSLTDEEKWIVQMCEN